MHVCFVMDVLEDTQVFRMMDRHVYIYCVYRYVPLLLIFLNSFFPIVCGFRHPPIFCWIISSKSRIDNSDVCQQPFSRATLAPAV